MKKYLLALLIALMLLLNLANGALAQEAPTITVSISIKGHLVLAGAEITVEDIDNDGTFTYDEAMQAAHAAYCPGGYDTKFQGLGRFVTRLWNESNNGWYTFYNNDVALAASVSSSVSAVNNGDRLYAAAFADTSAGSDLYTCFDKQTLTVKPNEPFTLTLSGTGAFGGTPAPISGISVGTWSNGTFTALEGATTDSTGTATIALSSAGKYILTAEGEINTAPIMPPICVVTVEE